MHTATFLLTAVAATALAGPIASRKLPWTAVDTTTTCDTSINQYIASPDPESPSIVEQVCQKFMPCAFPTQGMMCTQVLEHAMNGTQTMTVSDAEVLTEGEANIQEGEWKAKFTVTPATPAAPTTDNNVFNGVMWTAGDCTGYFTQLLTQSAPKGCMAADTGSGAGELTVGGEGSLKGTVFSLSFVDDAQDDAE